MRIAITGAATGIGAAVVQQFSGQGHEITAFDIVEPLGVDRWVPVDMSDMASVAQAAAAVEGPFDVLINNAGLPPRGDNAVKLLEVNVFGLIAFAEAMLPKLAQGGSIVSTASRAGQAWRENLDEVKALLALEKPDGIADFVAQRDMGATRAYALSKEATVVWNVKNAERFLRLGLRGNTVSPSAVETQILGDFITALGERATTSIARAGRAGSAQEIAAVIAFLARPESLWLKGQDITIDGGMTAFATADALEL